MAILFVFSLKCLKDDHLLLIVALILTQCATLYKTYTTRKVVYSHQLNFKTALKNTYTTSKAVSWDRQTTF